MSRTRDASAISAGPTARYDAAHLPSKNFVGATFGIMAMGGNWGRMKHKRMTTPVAQNFNDWRTFVHPVSTLYRIPESSDTAMPLSDWRV
uniref:Uncharacterized protein n=1 Tax=Ralstonia solanacearum TaxID=305 RepID=A0A0S4TPA1_RALSL|nr:protein of unknown function [Ralstonia solanacearum]